MTITGKCGSIPSFTATQVGALPSNWVTMVEEVVAEFAVKAVLVGGESTSLENAGVDIPYNLVTGDVVATHLPWLDRLYRSTFLELASAVSGAKMITSSSIVSGVNINVLEGRGARYERHWDSNPLTGVLFVTAHDASSGGQLLFELPGGDEVIVDPTPGLLLLFDATRIPHSVTPLTNDAAVRISIPMNFFDADVGEVRLPGVDDYLYANMATRMATESDESQVGPEAAGSSSERQASLRARTDNEGDRR